MPERSAALNLRKRRGGGGSGPEAAHGRHARRGRPEDHEEHGRRGFSYVGLAAAAWSTDDELDVTFYFVIAPGRVGHLRSNLGAQLEALRLGLGRVPPPDVDDDGPMVEALDEARRARRVHGRLHAIGAKHAQVLAAAFAHEALPIGVRSRFGTLAAVVLSLAAAKAESDAQARAGRRLEPVEASELRTAVGRHLAGQLPAAEIAHLRADAEIALAEARSAYAAARSERR